MSHRLIPSLLLGALASAASGCASTAEAQAVDVEAWRLLARGRVEQALDAFEGVATTSDDDAVRARCELGRSRALDALGRQGEATESARQVVDLAPELAQGHVDLGVLLLDQGEPVRALASFERALELDPTSAAAAYDRGLALAQLGADEPALEAFTAAVVLDPQLGPAHNGRGVLLARLERLEEAVEAFRLAARWQGGSEARLNYAGALHALGEAKPALLELNVAIRVEPDDPRPLLARAAILAELGDRELAELDLRAALDLAPGSAEIRARLAELRP